MARRDPVQFAIEAARIAHDFKSESIVALDLRGRSTVTDFTVIASGSSDRQRRSVAEKIVEYAKKLGDRPFGWGGHETANWIVLDFFDVVVHIFAQNYREYYDLELMWGDAPKIDWARAESA
jgi:ribosome-associated protein